MFQKIDSSLTSASMALGGSGKSKGLNAAGTFCRVQSIFNCFIIVAVVIVLGLGPLLLLFVLLFSKGIKPFM